MSTLIEKQALIVSIAQSFVGQKEISPNKSFVDPVFLSEMKKVGWYVGAPWCCFFAKLVWLKAGLNVMAINGNALDSYRNYEKIGYKGSFKPQVGALVVWRSAKNGVLVYSDSTKKHSPGHIGIVVKVHANGTFDTIEGNTTDKGGREGVMVANRYNRRLKWIAEKYDKTQLVGFINPM